MAACNGGALARLPASFPMNLPVSASMVCPSLDLATAMVRDGGDGARVFLGSPLITLRDEMLLLMPRHIFTTETFRALWT